MALKKGWFKDIWDEKYLILLALIFLLISTLLNFAAGIYVKRANVVAAPDIVLDITSTIDLSFLYVYGIIVITAILFLYTLFFKTKQLPKVIAQFSFLIMVRSFFICLTHLALPTTAVELHISKLLFFLILKMTCFSQAMLQFRF